MSFYATTLSEWMDNFAVSWGTLGCGRESGASAVRIPSIRVGLGLRLELESDLDASC